MHVFFGASACFRHHFFRFCLIFLTFELIIGAKMVFKVTLGCIVSGRVGPLVCPHPDAKKRSRTLYYGTVVNTIPNNLWRVFLHDLQLTSDHKPKELGFISPRKANCSDEELKVLSKSLQFMADKEDLTNYVDSKLPHDDMISCGNINSKGGTLALGNDHTNTASVKTEVNLQVLLPPCPSSHVATTRPNTSNATATIATARNVETNNDFATLNLNATKVSVDLSRLHETCRHSYSKEELDEYDSASINNKLKS